MPDATASIKFSGNENEIVSALDAIDKRIGGVAQRTENLQGLMTKLTVGFVTLRGAIELLDLASLGEDLADVRAGFDRMTGNADVNLARLRGAVNGTVDDLTLMKTANAAMAKGFDMEIISTAFAYAKLRADEMGDSFPATADLVTSALARIQEGSGGAARALVPLGLNGKTVEEVMGKMRQKMDDAARSGKGGADTIDVFRANLENARQTAGGFLATVLNPLIAGFNMLAERANIAAGIASNPLFDMSGKQVGSAGATGTQTYKAQVLSLEQLTGLLTNMEDKQRDAFLASYALNVAAINNDRQRLRETIKLYDAEASILDQNTDEYRTNRGKRAAADKALSDLNKQQVDDRLSKAAQERASLLQDMALQRQMLETSVASGAATLKDRQDQINEQVKLIHARYATEMEAAKGNAALTKQLERELFAFDLSIAQDRVGLATRVTGQREKESTALLNLLMENADRELQYDGLSETARRANRLATLQQMRNDDQIWHDLNVTDRTRLLAEIYQAERDYTEAYRQEIQNRVGIMMDLFGNTFVNDFSAMLSGSKKVFDTFLQDLLRSILRFLVNAAVVKFLTMLVSGPLAGLFGGGGAAWVGSPILSAPGGGIGGAIGGGNLTDTIMQSISPTIRMIGDVNRQASMPSYNAPPIQVSILADGRDLYYTVEHGRHLARKTDLSGHTGNL
jgi:hypothetical protein